MNRSFFTSRTYAAFGLIVLVVIGAAAFFFTRQRPIPVTGGVRLAQAPATGNKAAVAAANAAAPAAAAGANVAPSQGGVIDLGGGNILVVRPDGSQAMAHSNPVPAGNDSGAGKLLTTLPDGLEIYAGQPGQEAAPNLSPSQNIDLGGGVRLSADAEGAKISGGRMPTNYASRTIDLGAGFQLVITPAGRRIYAPLYPSATYQWKDIGAGYVLVMHNGSEESLAPVALLKTGEVVSAPKVIDLSGGYSLVLASPANGVVAPASQPAPGWDGTPPARIIDVGNGYYLSMDPRSEVVTGLK